MDSKQISQIIRSQIGKLWETQKYHCVELSRSLASSRSILIIDRSSTNARILDQIITVHVVPVENLNKQSDNGLWRCEKVQTSDSNHNHAIYIETRRGDFYNSLTTG